MTFGAKPTSSSISVNFSLESAVIRQSVRPPLDPRSSRQCRPLILMAQPNDEGTIFRGGASSLRRLSGVEAVWQLAGRAQPKRLNSPTSCELPMVSPASVWSMSAWCQAETQELNLLKVRAEHRLFLL